MAQTPFLQGQTAAAVRNNYSGFVGMRFTVGSSAMNVAALGRIYLSGNNQTHTVKLVNAQTGLDVPGASTQVAMKAGTPGTYQYTTLPAAVQLTAATSYFLVSQETSGGDTWYDYTPVTSTADAAVNGPVYLGSAGNYVLVGVPAPSSWSYVPANFEYSLGAVTPPPTITITQPAANSVLTGIATISATATASAGLTVSNVQFYLNGSPVGSAVLATPYQISLDTTAFSDGTYSLSAIATDSGGNTGQSSPVSITLTNGNGPAGSPFVTSASFGVVRNNFTGLVGMQFTVGSQALTINALGRIFITGNTGTHTLKLVNASTGLDISGGSVQLSLTGGTAQQFRYQPLASPLTLAAGTSYYLVSQETFGGDQWYDYGPLNVTNVATVPGAVYNAGSSYNPVAAPGFGYVPLSFLYGAGTSPVTHPPPSVTVTSPSAGSVNGTVNFSATANAATGLQIVNLQLLLDGVNFGVADTVAAASVTTSQSLATGTLSSGTHTLTAIAIDSAGQSTTSASVAIIVSNGSGPAVTPLITAQALQTPLRSNFTGQVGMQFQVGKSALTVTQLGRFCVTGNSQFHIVKLVQTSGADVVGGSVSVSMAGCTGGQYRFAPLSSALTLPANTSYYLVSAELTSGDQWYDLGPVTASSAATVVGPVYSPGSGYFPVGAPGSSYVPVNLQYATTVVIPPTISITAPAASATVSGVITITANATAAAGSSIAGVQFQQTGTSIGAAVIGSGPSFSTQLDTTTLLNGSYNLTAIATDSAGASTTSAQVAIIISNAGSKSGSPFITQQSFGAARNNFSGFVGMQFATAGQSFSISQLGRICVGGNTGAHTVKLVTASGVDVAGGSANVNMSGCTPGSYSYGSLSSPVTLAGGTTYYLVGLETSGADQWYDYGAVTTTSLAAVNGPVYYAGNVYNFVNLAGNSFGPYNFLYTVAAVAPPLVSITSPAPNTVLSGVVTVTATATASPGLTIASVQLQRSGINIGLPVTGSGPTFSATLDTRPLADGGYNLSAVAIDSANNATFSTYISVSTLNNIKPPTVSVTTPKTGITGTGLLSVSASAAPAAGTSLTALQLQVDGQNFGAPCTAGTCTAVLDTSLLPDGTHVLTALATDADEGSATSAGISFTAQNTLTGIGVLNGFLPATARTFAGWIGMQFTTTCTPISVTAVGRIYVPGNTGTHQVKLVLASTGADVPGSSATVSFTGAIANRMVYGTLASPITLQPNTAYYLVSQESATGDQFYDFLPILTNAAVTVNGPAYLQNSTWITPQNPNYIYVPVDLKFTVPGVPFPSAVTVVNSTVAATPVPPIVPAAYNHILIDGQSLAVGSNGSPPLSVTQPYSNLMLNTGNTALIPLIEGLGYSTNVDTNEETIASAMGNTLTRTSSALSFTDIVTNAAVGGYSYAQLAKGTTPYANAIAQLNAARSLSQTANKSYKFTAVALMHGETDQGLGASAATYEGYLVQWQNNFQTDGQVITGQTDSVPFFIDQTNSWTYSNVATPTVALGQVAAAQDHPNNFYLVGPKYQYHYTDGVHMDNYSYRKQGEQFGKAMSETLLGGTAWKALTPKSITRTGNVITAQFNVPVQPLQFDTSTVLPKAGMGFEYTDGSTCSPFIVSAQITAGDTVTITLSATPSGTSEHLRYAFTGIVGAFAGKDSPGAPRGNLKDSDATVSAYGYDLSNWAVAFDQLVVAH